jgi:hypothetical protein
LTDPLTLQSRNICHWLFCSASANIMSRRNYTPGGLNQFSFQLPASPIAQNIQAPPQPFQQQAQHQHAAGLGLSRDPASLVANYATDLRINTAVDQVKVLQIFDDITVR